MLVLLIINETATDFSARTDPARAPAYWAGWKAYSEALAAAGVVRGGGALAPPAAAATLRIRGDQRTVHDGPYADTKEILGGYLVLEVPDTDTALAWAARCPTAATGSVEVRPILPLHG
jgi:hypothetical protein